MRISDWSSDVCSSDLRRRASRSRGRRVRTRSCRFALHRNLAAEHVGVAIEIDIAAREDDERALGGLDLAREQGGARDRAAGQRGKAPCRGGVCQYVQHSGVAVEVNTKNKNNKN